MAGKIVSRLVTELRADGKKMRADLEGNVRDTQKWGRNVAGIVAGAVAALGAAKFVRSVVEATSIQERALSQLQQGLITTNGKVGQSFEQLVGKAAKLQDVTTIGDENIIAAQAQLVTFTKIAGNEFDRTIELAADLSTRFGGDLKGSVLQLGKALNDPVKNLSALSRAGIQFADDQKVLIKSLFESGQEAEAQRIILQELEVQFGGSARAARDTFGGALEGLKNAAGDLLEADGLSGVTSEIEMLTTIVQDPAIVSSVNTLTSAIIKGFGASAKAIATTVNLTTFLAEELAAAVSGPAIGDVVRLEDALAGAREELTRLENARGRSQRVSRQKDLREEIALLEARLKISRELSNVTPATAQATGSQAGAIAGGESASTGIINPSNAGTDKEFEKLELSLQRQIDLYGQTSVAAKLRYDLENGQIKNLEAARIDSLVAMATQIDDLAARELDTKKNVADEKKRIEDDEKARSDLLSNIERIEEESRTETEIIAAVYENRQEMLDTALEQKLLSEARYKDLSLKLDKQADAERRSIAAKGFGTLLKIADRYYDGLNTKEAARVRAAIQLGTVLLDKEKRDSLKRIAINTYDAAMGAYKALASIPYVGPFLGAAAAGGIIALGGAYAADVAGIAHGGLDNVPRESTYLLDKGERVISPRQNQDLTTFLSSDASQNKNSAGVVVNINEAPGVKNEVSVDERNGQTIVTIEQKIREVTRDEMLLQSAPGGLLDTSYRV